MALQTTGPISILDIANEFGGTAPHSMNEYYGVAGGIPTSGIISIGDFYGAENVFIFTISTNQQNADIRALAVNAGWDETAPVECTVNSNVWLWSNNTTLPGATISGDFPGGLVLYNDGKIIGKGGNGGSGNGGIALAISSSDVSIVNATGGYIAGRS